MENTLSGICFFYIFSIARTEKIQDIYRSIQPGLNREKRELLIRENCPQKGGYGVKIPDPGYVYRVPADAGIVP